MAFNSCPYCHLIYEPHEKGVHARYHKKWVEAEQTLGYLPASSPEQESAKFQASQLLRHGTAEQKLEGALSLFKAHFDRSLAGAIEENYWKKHPSLEEYIAMVDYETDLIPPEVLQKIREKYGRIEGEIPPGYTYWYPPRTKARKLQFARAMKNQ